MFYHPASDTYLTPGRAFTLGDSQYPADWLSLTTLEDKQLHGIVPVSYVGEPADPALFITSEERANGIITFVNTPRPPEVLLAAASALRDQLIKDRKVIREQALDRLMGIAGRAQRAGNTALAEAADAAAESLLTIFDNLPPDLEGTVAEVTARYAVIVNTAVNAAPYLLTVFAKQD